MKNIKIAIDGPASSGKSTTAKILAQKLGFIYIDTGAMYRAVTLYFINSANTEFNDKILDNIEISFSHDIDNSGELNIILNDKNVSKQIRSNAVNSLVSTISAFPAVREKLVSLQRKMSDNANVILDGRDIGTVVFPDAELKIFLVASIEARASRRYEEMRQTDPNADFEQIKQSIQFRDKQDRERAVSPLRKAEDAIEIDTSNLTIEEQVDAIISYFNDLK